MIIHFVMDSRIYEFFVEFFSKLGDYFTGMYTVPKYIVLRNILNIILFTTLSGFWF